MILEYTPYRACEPIIKTLVSVSTSVRALEWPVPQFQDFKASLEDAAVCALVLQQLGCLAMQAGANAKENLGLKKLKLYVSECYCNEGPILKRIKTRAKGR